MADTLLRYCIPTLIPVGCTCFGSVHTHTYTRTHTHALTSKSQRVATKRPRHACRHHRASGLSDASAIPKQSGVRTMKSSSTRWSMMWYVPPLRPELTVQCSRVDTVAFSSLSLSYSSSLSRSTPVLSRLLSILSITPGVGRDGLSDSFRQGESRISGRATAPLTRQANDRPDAPVLRVYE